MMRRTTGVACGALGAGLLVSSLVGCSLIFPFDATQAEADLDPADAIAPADASFSEGSAPSDASHSTDTDGKPTSDTSTPKLDSGLCSLSCTTGWCPMKGPSDSHKLHGIWGQSLHELWAVGEKLTLLRIDPQSCAWVPWLIDKDLGPTLFNKLSGITLWGVWGSSAGDVYAVGDTGTILRFDGKKWSQEKSGTTEFLRAVGGSASQVFAVGHNAQLLGRETGGVWKNWTSGVGGGVALTGISGKVPGATQNGSWAYYAVGVGGSFTYHDGVASKTFSDVTGWVSGCAQKSWQAVWGAPTLQMNMPEVVLVGQGGAVMRMSRTSSKATPSCVLDVNGSKDLEAVDGRDADDIWIVGDSGSVYQRKGSTWTPRTLPSNYSSSKLRGIWVAKSGQKLAIAISEAKTILFTLY